jgi:hypothetical protein
LKLFNFNDGKKYQMMREALSSSIDGSFKMGSKSFGPSKKARLIAMVRLG